MKYGLTRRLYVYSVEGQVGEEVFATAGDYLRSQFWCQKNLKGMEDGIADLYQAYAWAWYALERQGKLAGYGIAEEISLDALNDMASVVAVNLEAIKDDSLPLEGSPTQPMK